MILYLVKKASILLLSLFLITTLTFFLMHAIPGDPFAQEQAIPKEILKALHRHYGLDQPLFIQYLAYLKGLLFWDLGPSFKFEGRTVNAIIADGFPISACLGIEALCLAITGGIALGAIAALYHQRWQDRWIMGLAVLGISIPSFILATLMQYILAMKFDLFPIARWGSFSHTVMPAIALSAMPIAFIARLTRASMIEVLHQDHIQTARAKGLSSIHILLHHVLRNAILPVVSYLGPLTASVLTGSFIIEKIFSIPGLGQWFVMSIANRDYTVIMGTTIFYSIILLSSVFLMEILYSYIDPRIKHQIREAAHG